MSGEPELAPGINHQTGTSYTVKHSDRECLITFSNANPVAVTVPRAIAAFGSGFRFRAINLGVGTVTFTPVTSTINGAATLAMTTGQTSEWESDGTNWSASDVTTGPKGDKGDTGAAGLGLLFSEGHYINGGLSNVGAAANIADVFNTPDTGTMNALGRHLIVRGSGSFTTIGGQTPTFTLSCNFGGVEFITFTTGALAAGVTGKFDFEFVLVTTTTGAGGNGLGRGSLNIQLAGPGAYTNYRNSGVTAAGIGFNAPAGITLRAASSATISSVTIDETTGQIL